MSKKTDNSRILVISDLHIPYHHQDAIPFLTALQKKYKFTRVICIGDEVDNHALSYHDHNPDLMSAGNELSKAIECLKPLYKLFPKVEILESNHGSLLYRKAVTHGIPKLMLRQPGDVLEAPKGWTWHMELKIKLPTGYDCYFHHSKGANVLKNSQAMGMSFVQGHHHEKFDIQYWGNPDALLFGMTVGCLADPHSLALAYAKNNLKRQVLGVGVILDGRPLLIPMILNTSGRWIKKL
jgi:hypothetical protein